MKTWRTYFNEVNEIRKKDGIKPIEVTDFIKWMYGFNNIDDKMTEKDIEKWCK